MSSFRTRPRRKLKSDINVVPYIDVMLVLLIIFMVTAPLLNLGVDIELPQSNARPIESTDEPVIIVVQASGDLTLRLQGANPEAIEPEALVAKLSAFVRQNPGVPVFVAGDDTASYGTIYQVMAMVQQSGAGKVALMSQPAAPPARR